MTTAALRLHAPAYRVPAQTSETTLHLEAPVIAKLLDELGPSAAMWRAAEIAVLRNRAYQRPIVELGCGDGLVASESLSHVELGIDADADGLKRAQLRGTYENLIESALDDAPVGQGSMGTVLATTAFGQAADVETLMRSAARMLRSGGHLVFTVPTERVKDWLLSSSRIYTRARGSQLAHHNLWPLHEWELHLRRTGFRVVETRPYLRASLVRAWDWLELARLPRLGGREVWSFGWNRLSPRVLRVLSRQLSAIDLGSSAPGGGRLVIARKA